MPSPSSIPAALRLIRLACLGRPQPFTPAALAPGLGSAAAPPATIPRPYAAFLRLCGGLVTDTGTVRLLGPAAASMRVFGDGEDLLPGGDARWFRFGEVAGNPLCLERATGRVWWFGDLDAVWFTAPHAFAPLCPSFDVFFLRLLCGSWYGTVAPVGRDSAWWRMVLALGWAEARPSPTASDDLAVR
ncbi:hypothetical protein ACQEU5_20195 [Marinactinospora thermotolerans]|uniref:SMI1/KNR4 family protein n=1 Tax=Marinactinospora thermotolerans DSM 45154 TaxID=1122192 RepID=A0A1T4PVV8_9ACTN|nr:hypothetical protein [Marinactinospora thermotolerans]SJZ95622.1 hypothetical protein SAMN02745673_02029 [Marinactinospora thermotolerans DSM 45154]